MPATLLAATGVETLVVGGEAVPVAVVPEVLGAVVLPPSNTPEMARMPTTAPTDTAPAMKDGMRLMARYPIGKSISGPEPALLEA
jgi:hypothetical protein